MLTYFISASNNFTIRTEANPSYDIRLNLQNMITQENFTASLENVSINYYESILSFSASISGARVGDEYRATITLSGFDDQPIWNGSIQAFVSQSDNKPEYVNQIPLPENGINPYISNVTTNEYIILP
jgi:hypothetical protein